MMKQPDQISSIAESLPARREASHNAAVPPFLSFHGESISSSISMRIMPAVIV